MAVKFTNNARTTLAADISNSATTATVTSGSVFPVLNAGEYFYCTFDNGTNNEIVKVTARSGNTLTIVRGVDNTTARAFSTDDAAELRATAGLLTDIQENIAAKSANQTVYNATTASSATDYDIGIDPGLESNAMVFLNGVMQHHDTFSFSGSTLTFDTAPSNGLALEVIVDNLINLQSSNLTVDTFTAADVGGNPQVDFVLSDAPAGETNLIVFVDGVFQANDTYTISSTTLSMTDGVTADMTVTVYVMNPVNIGAPSDNTVTSSKLSGNITMPADLTVTGDVAFDSPTFVVDNANSRVGIGTASPSTLLDIVGDVKMSANLTVDTTTLVVDSTNNRVGIGTTSPSAPLHVAGNIQTDAVYRGYDSVSGSYRNLLGYDSGNVKIQTGTGSSAYGVSIFTAGTERFHVDGSGNVGIGTDSPDTLLNIASSSAPTLRIENTDSTLGLNQVIGAVEFYKADTSGGGAGVAGGMQLLSTFSTGSRTSLTFSTSNADGNNVERLRIDDSGNVGIGTSSPSSYHAKGDNLVIATTGDTGMSIVSGTSSTGRIFFADGTSGGAESSGQIKYDHNSNYMSIHTSDNERMRIDSSGNVGIGTDNPSEKLHIRDSSTNADVYIKIANDSRDWFMGVEGSNSDILSFKTHDASNLLNIDSSGNLGIGVTAPKTKLHLGDNDQLGFGTGSSTKPDFRISYVSASNSLGIKCGTGGEGVDVTLTPTADLTIAGALSKGSGSFRIDHPLESKKDTHQLVHSFVEAPQADNIYRGVVVLENGTATINLDTVSGMSEGTYVLLNTNTSCFTSNETDWDAVKGSVSGNILTISCQNTASTATVSWLVIGERHDQHMKDTDWTDSDGKVIVEPTK